MEHFAGLDVSVKETSVCVVDDTGRIAREVKVASEAEALLAVLSPRHARAFLREGQRSLAVMCPAFLCGRTWTAGLDGFRGSRPYQLIGI